MAIHPDLPNIKVEVVVDGKVAPEFDDPDTRVGENTVSKYIEAQSGKSLEVNFVTFGTKKKNRKTHDIHCRLLIDGQRIGNVQIGKSRLGNQSTRALVSKLTNPIKFGDMAIDETNTAKYDASCMSSLNGIGVIQVTITSGEIDGALYRKAKPNPNCQCKSFDEEIAIPKAAFGNSALPMTAVSLCARPISKSTHILCHACKIEQASLQQKKFPQGYTVTRRFKTSPNKSPVLFQFYYRSQEESLMALGVVPDPVLEHPVEEQAWQPRSLKEAQEATRRLQARIYELEHKIKDEANVKIKHEADVKKPLKRNQSMADDDELSLTEERPTKRRLLLEDPFTGADINSAVVID